MLPAIWPPARSMSPSPPAGGYATPAIESRFEGSTRRHFRQQETLRSRGLCRCPACSGGTDATRASSTALRKIGMTRKVAITVPDFVSAARLVATGSMIATMPSRIAVHYSKHYRLNVFEVPLQLPELDIAMAFHPRAMSDPAIIWLMDEIRGDAGRTNVNSAGTRLRPPIRKPTVPARQAGVKRRNVA